MIEITNATANDYRIIQQIAQETWPVTYGTILSSEQIDYMFDMMYSLEVLEEQVNLERHHFILAKEDDIYLGFASYELNYQNTVKTKIHKIYLLPKSQRKGIGSLLISEIVKEAKKNNNTSLSLNVNRYNKAFYFYQKIGFVKVGEEDINIGNDYIMEDYIMEKTI